MDYKKEYERAFGIAKMWYRNTGMPDNVKNILSNMFPELVDGKDEKIRKELVMAFESLNTIKVWNGIKRADILAWLEKQGVEKTDTDFSDLRTWEYIVDAVLTEKEGIGQYLDDPVTEEIAKKLRERFGNIEQSESSTKLAGIYPEDLVRLIDKDEKKSPDKAEPKFKVKDWIVSAGGKVLQVTGIEGDSYVFNNGYGHCYYWTIQNCDKECHPWSFKDGDIITCECGWTCIFKALIDDETFSSYCFMDATRHVFETGSDEYHTLRRDGGIRTYNGKFYPATKMQAASFLDEICGAGYTWNSKKKQLREW